MATKKEILDVANHGNWWYHNGENRCTHCGKYQYENTHNEDCPLGVLISLIEENIKE